MFLFSSNVFFCLPLNCEGSNSTAKFKIQFMNSSQCSVSRELLFRQNKAIKTEHGWNYCGVKPAKLLF